MKNLEIVQVQEGAKIGQIDNYPRNIALFDKWNEELEIHARSTGAAQEEFQETNLTQALLSEALKGKQ